MMRNPFVRWAALILGAVLLSLGGAWVASRSGWSHFGLAPRAPDEAGKDSSPPSPPLEMAAPNTGTGPSENLFKIFAAAPPLQASQFRLTDLPRVFPAFVHRPFGSAGFNAVMLPFTYSDPQQLGDANEAMALSAIISNDMDWSPGCYCARHAYFVFKREREAVARFLEGYDADQVAGLIGRWAATHAIGGRLIRTAAGYKGELDIFDRSGKTVFSRQYDTERSYWALLGDMDVDALTFLDVEPSQKLKDYLHQPRCKQFQSVLDLGSAAMMDDRTPDEFGTYQKILTADPGFSMVRHWYANQKHWHDGDTAYWTAQNALALSARLEPASIEEFTSANCPDPDMVAQLPKWLDEADALVPDFPRSLACRLRNACYGSEGKSRLMERALKVAAQNPNWNDLLLELGNRLPDRFMGASLLTASVFDHYMDAVGGKDNELYDLALACIELCRDDLAVQILTALGPGQPKFHLDVMLQSLCRGGRYAEATDLYPLLFSGPGEQNLKKNMAPYAAFAAVVTSKPQLLDQILKDQHEPLAALGLTDVFQSYADAIAGKNVNIAYGNDLSAAEFWRMFLICQADALHGKSMYHSRVTSAMSMMPMYRNLWIVQDFYQRRDPSPDGPAFYDFLEMLFSYDPWVSTAVENFRQRGGRDQPIDPHMLRDDLKHAIEIGPKGIDPDEMGWKHVPTAWRVAACTGQLLMQNKLAEASEITRLYDQFASGGQNTDLVSIARELRRRVVKATNRQT